MVSNIFLSNLSNWLEILGEVLQKICNNILIWCDMYWFIWWYPLMETMVKWTSCSSDLRVSPWWQSLIEVLGPCDHWSVQVFFKHGSWISKNGHKTMVMKLEWIPKLIDLNISFIYSINLKVKHSTYRNLMKFILLDSTWCCNYTIPDCISRSTSSRFLVVLKAPKAEVEAYAKPPNRRP